MSKDPLPKISKALKYADNPRQITGEQFNLLKKHLETLGDLSGVVYCTKNKAYLGGNQRSEVFDGCEIEIVERFDKPTKQKTVAHGFITFNGEKFAYREVAFTKSEFKQACIVANSNGGDWDWDVLANGAWQDEPLVDWGLETPVDWASGNNTVEEDEATVADIIDKAVELNKKWKVKRGDLWQIGEHRLLCGDSTNADDVGTLFAEGGGQISLVWTDPPYGVKYGDKIDAANPMGYRVRGIKNDDLNDEDLAELLRTAMNNIGEYCVQGAAIYAACPAGKPLPTAIQAFVGSCFEFRWQLVWVKNSLVLSRADYHFRHENVLYGWKRDGGHYFTDDRTQDSVFEVPRPTSSDEHPTMKPVDLIVQMVRNSSKEGEIVADMFGGSGSTMAACEAIHRKARLVELEPTYCAVILERMTNLGLEAKLVKNTPSKQ